MGLLTLWRVALRFSTGGLRCSCSSSLRSAVDSRWRCHFLSFSKLFNNFSQTVFLSVISEKNFPFFRKQFWRGEREWSAGCTNAIKQNGAPRSYSTSSQGLMQHADFLVRQLKRNMCQNAATPSFQPIFFPSS